MLEGVLHEGKAGFGKCSPDHIAVQNRSCRTGIEAVKVDSGAGFVRGVQHVLIDAGISQEMGEITARMRHDERIRVDCVRVLAGKFGGVKIDLLLRQLLLGGIDLPRSIPILEHDGGQELGDTLVVVAGSNQIGLEGVVGGNVRRGIVGCSRRIRQSAQILDEICLGRVEQHRPEAVEVDASGAQVQLVSLVQAEAVTPGSSVPLIAVQLDNGLPQLVEGLQVAEAGQGDTAGAGDGQRSGCVAYLILQRGVIQIRDEEQDGVNEEKKRECAEEESAEQARGGCLLSCRKRALVAQDSLRKEPRQKSPLWHAGRNLDGLLGRTG